MRVGDVKLPVHWCCAVRFQGRGAEGRGSRRGPARPRGRRPLSAPSAFKAGSQRALLAPWALEGDTPQGTPRRGAAWHFKVEWQTGAIRIVALQCREDNRASDLATRLWLVGHGRVSSPWVADSPPLPWDLPASPWVQVLPGAPRLAVLDVGHERSCAQKSTFTTPRDRACVSARFAQRVALPCVPVRLKQPRTHNARL